MRIIEELKNESFLLVGVGVESWGDERLFDSILLQGRCLGLNFTFQGFSLGPVTAGKRCLHKMVVLPLMVGDCCRSSFLNDY